MLVVLLMIIGAGGLVFWALWRSSELTQRLHPLTPEQRQRKRRAHAVMIPLIAASIGLAVAIGSGGTAAVAALAVIGAIILLDAVLTPLVHYRRARRSGSDRRGRTP